MTNQDICQFLVQQVQQDNTESTHVLICEAHNNLHLLDLQTLLFELAVSAKQISETRKAKAKVVRNTAAFRKVRPSDQYCFGLLQDEEESLPEIIDMTHKRLSQ